MSCFPCKSTIKIPSFYWSSNPDHITGTRPIYIAINLCWCLFITQNKIEGERLCSTIFSYIEAMPSFKIRIQILLFFFLHGSITPVKTFNYGRFEVTFQIVIDEPAFSQAQNQNNETVFKMTAFWSNEMPNRLACCPSVNSWHPNSNCSFYVTSESGQSRRSTIAWTL